MVLTDKGVELGSHALDAGQILAHEVAREEVDERGFPRPTCCTGRKAGAVMAWLLGDWAGMKVPPARLSDRGLLISADMYARGGQAGLINRDFRDERSLVAAVVVPFRTLCDRSQRSLPAVG